MENLSGCFSAAMFLALAACSTDNDEKANQIVDKVPYIVFVSATSAGGYVMNGVAYDKAGLCQALDKLLDVLPNNSVVQLDDLQTIGQLMTPLTVASWHGIPVDYEVDKGRKEAYIPQSDKASKRTDCASFGSAGADHQGEVQSAAPAGAPAAASR